MGCDIHLFAEARGADGVWRHINEIEDREVYDSETGDVKGFEPRPIPFYSGRNYGLFGVLAGVRWQCPHGQIAEQRGLPADVSPEVQGEADDWGEDGHSHSYLTLAELIAYDWTKPVPETVRVGSRGYAYWQQMSKNWGEHTPQSIYELGTHHQHYFDQDAKPDRISAVEMEGRYNAALAEYAETKKDLWATLERHLGNANADMTFPVPLYESFGTFLGKTLPKLFKHGRHDDVRIVFWFDN